FAGRLFLNVDIENDTIGRRPRLARYLHALEIREILQAPLGPIDEGPIVGVALGEVEFAPNHVVARAGITADVDAFDVGTLSFVHGEHKVHRSRLRIAGRPRTDRREGKAYLGRLDGHVFDGLLDRFGVVDIAWIGPHPPAQQCGIERPNGRLNFGCSDAILLALFDRVGDHETTQDRIVLSDCRDDSYVDIAVLEVEAAQQLAIGFHPVGIVDIASLQEGEKPRRRGLDDVFETVRRIGAIADEVDLSDPGLRAFGNFEDEIDPVVGKLDDLWLDANVEAAAAAVDLDQACGVCLHHRARQRPALL